jgi:hypothetical protein
LLPSLAPAAAPPPLRLLLLLLLLLLVLLLLVLLVLAVDASPSPSPLPLFLPLEDVSFNGRRSEDGRGTNSSAWPPLPPPLRGSEAGLAAARAQALPPDADDVEDLTVEDEADVEEGKEGAECCFCFLPFRPFFDWTSQPSSSIVLGLASPCFSSLPRTGKSRD